MCKDHPAHLPRRGLLTAGVAGLFAASLGRRGLAQSAPSPNDISPDEALKQIMGGNARYAANTTQNVDYSRDRASRATAQYPIAGILTCADSRVSPELTFDQAPGQLFVVRVAGNFVNDDGLASLEYGVQFLGVPLLMVMGHTNCGAVAATIKVMKDNAKLPGHLPDLVDSIKPGIDLAITANAADLLSEAIVQNVRYNVRRLREATPIIAEAVAAGKVKVVGSVYDIAAGKVMLL